jgi:hypothetical protein
MFLTLYKTPTSISSSPRSIESPKHLVMAHWVGIQQHYRKSPILNAVLWHEQGRTLLLRRYRDMLIAEKARLEQRAEVLKGEMTKQHKAIVGCKKSLIQQRECFEAVLEECREECRQEAEYTDMLSMQVTRRGSELDACWRDQTNKEALIQSITDIMMETLGVKDTDEIYKMQVLTVDAQGILGALCVGLCSEVKLHKVQREKST